MLYREDKALTPRELARIMAAKVWVGGWLLDLDEDGGSVDQSPTAEPPTQPNQPGGGDRQGVR